MAAADTARERFDPRQILTGNAAGQARLQLAPHHIICEQGDPADAVFYLERGSVKISVVAWSGKEAVMALRGAGAFLGTGCLVEAQRRSAATTVTACVVVRIAKAAVIRMLRDEPDFAEMFAISLVRQRICDQESIVDQLTNSSEKRLARALLQIANAGRGDNPQAISTCLDQTALANMIGTTRPRVSFFMNKFRRQGLIEYDRRGRLSVHNALLKVFLEQ
jgi:CRP/FNR family cyclic AMP-dependent transcriptional regulator